MANFTEVDKKDQELNSEFGDVLIIGTGAVGGKIAALNRHNPRVETVSHHDGDRVVFDITKLDQVRRLVHESKASAVINAVAFTNVNEAEKLRGNDDTPHQLNVVGAKNVAIACKETGKLCVLLSTDSALLQRQDHKPREINDPLCTNPTKNGIYGKSKAEGEIEAQAVGGLLAIVRIAYPNFYAKTYKLLAGGFSAYDDLYISPTDIAGHDSDLNVGLKIITTRNLTGILHIACPEVVTPYNYALLMKELDSTLAGITIKAGSFMENQAKPGVAPRPQYAALSVASTEVVLGKKFRTLREQILAGIAERTTLG